TAIEGSAILTVTNSTFSGNSAGSSGGGITNNALGASSRPMVTVTNSTLSGNSAGIDGGGIDNFADGHGSATLTITNSTLSGNSAPYGGGAVNAGVDASASLTIGTSTLSGNSADLGGGGIYNVANRGGATLTIGDTILKTGASGENIFNPDGTVTSDGYNLSSDDGGGYLTGTGDQINTDPMLGPLQDNGGPTFTQ